MAAFRLDRTKLCPVRLLLLIAVLASVFCAVRVPADSPRVANDPTLERGRELFSAKCGKCHDADGRKRLADGSTLLTRLAASKDRQALLGTRLKSLPPDDRQAVTLYVEGLLAATPSR